MIHKYSSINADGPACDRCIFLRFKILVFNKNDRNRCLNLKVVVKNAYLKQISMIYYDFLQNIINILSD